MKADEPRQNRIPFMMSDAELTAVDDWRFKNRIATRAEAIRRLTASGLALDESLVPLLERIIRDMNNVNEGAEELGRFLDQVRSGEEITREQALRLADLCLAATEKYEQMAWSTLEEASNLLRNSAAEAVKARLSDALPFKNVLTAATDLIRRTLGRESGGRK